MGVGALGAGALRWCAASLAASLASAPTTAAAEPPTPPGLVPPDATGPSAQSAQPVTWTLPPDAARRYSPFFNGMLGGLSVGRRFDSNAYFGAELGAFFGPWRASLRAWFPFGVQQETGLTMSNQEFRSIAATKPALIGGATLGVALYSGPGFVASFGVAFMRTDVPDFGNLLGVSLPLEWVTRGGVRIGTEPGFLGAFGGEVVAECNRFDPMPSTRECDDGELRAFDRESGTGVWLHFLIGIPFDSPPPVPVPMGAPE